MLKLAIPGLHVRDSAKAEAFYCKALGFQRAFTYRVDETKADPCYMGLTRDDAWLHVSSFSGDGVSGACVYLVVDDVDALHEELTRRGVPIQMPPTDQTWGNRELYVKDPDGNSIRFIQHQ